MITFDNGNTAPTFADRDGDGDLDAFVGEGSGRTLYLKNEGTTLSPNFVFDPFDPFGPIGDLQVGGGLSVPTFADIDDDGDLDAFIGSGLGTILFLRNIGGNTSPNLIPDLFNLNNPLKDVNVGSNAKPSFADIDGDGDLDAFIGEIGTELPPLGDANIIYFRNDGTSLSPDFQEIAFADFNPLSIVSVSQNSAPTFADIDGDGDLDAFIGERDGTISYYENINPPVAGFDTVATLTNTAINIPVDDLLNNDLDPDNDELMILAVSPVANTIGEVILNNNGTPDNADDDFVTYTPEDGYIGVDLFEYTLVDDTFPDSPLATGQVIVQVDSPTTAPVAQDDSFVMLENAILEGNVLNNNGSGPDSDPNGDPLTVTSVNGSDTGLESEITLGSGALLTLNGNGDFEYNPHGQFDYLAAGESATDTFSYAISDGVGGLGTARVTVTITGVNDDPTVDVLSASVGFVEAGEASDQTLSENGSVSFDDIDNGALVDISFDYQNDISWSSGSLDSDLASALVAGFSGTEIIDSSVPGSTPWNYSASVNLDFLAEGESITFSYGVTAADENGGTNSAMLDFEIIGTNDTPVVEAIPDRVAVAEEAFSFDAGVFFSDKDANDSLTYALVNSPAWLNIESESGVIVGTPPVSAVGVNNLEVTATDSEGDSISDELVLTVFNQKKEGNDADNRLRGSVRTDLIYGRGGRDTLIGLAGNDLLVGGADNDILRGGADNDILMGGDGRDLLRGGPGADVYVLALHEGIDIIEGYQKGMDRIGLEGGLTFGVDVTSQRFYGWTLILAQNEILGVIDGRFLLEADDFTDVNMDVSV